jgi:hypothetical protein
MYRKYLFNIKGLKKYLSLDTIPLKKKMTQRRFFFQAWVALFRQCTCKAEHVLCNNLQTMCYSYANCKLSKNVEALCKL